MSSISPAENMGGHDFEDRPGHSLRLDLAVVLESGVDRGEEIVWLRGLPAPVPRVPAFPEDAAQQQGQLGAQLRAFIDHDLIAQSM